MVNPAHIEEAERIGMPAEDEPVMVECPTCHRDVDEEKIYKCEECGFRCCKFCRIEVEKYMASFCKAECSNKFLLDELEKVEDEADKYWKLSEAAKKAATTGYLGDLHDWLEMRRNLLGL